MIKIVLSTILIFTITLSCVKKNDATTTPDPTVQTDTLKIRGADLSFLPEIEQEAWDFAIAVQNGSLSEAQPPPTDLRTKTRHCLISTTKSSPPWKYLDLNPNP